MVGTRATHIVPEACWAVSLLAVLLLWPSTLAIIVSPWKFGLALTSYRTSNFPTDGTNCRVTVFGPSPLQWICKEWVQKLGSDKAMACFKGEKHTESGSPTSQGERTPRSRMEIPNSSRSHRNLLPFLGPPSSSSWSSPPDRGDLCCNIFLSSVHPPPTLISHPCLSSSARPIGHSFWYSASYCGPHRPI